MLVREAARRFVIAARGARDSAGQGEACMLAPMHIASLNAPRRPALPDWLTTRPIAHRGLHDGERPENTCAAFEAALARGYPIELDVHVLPDGEVVVFHDDDLMRAAGVARTLAQESRTSIRSYRVFGSEQTIPSLREVLALVNGRVPLLIEIKARDAPGALGPPILALLSAYRGPFALQSFNPWALAYFHRHAPEIVCGQLGGPLKDDNLKFAERLASEHLVTWLVSRAQFLNYDLRALPNRWVKGVARMFSLPLLAWTVRSEGDKRKAEALGVNYVFDHVRP
jgi:glycerophosphoryl diester phosphodiesterase